ncbi:MAG TPA: anti-sigma factor [Terriglobales bacterium]
MIKLRCEDVRREISNYIDGDISPRNRELLEAHLEQCQRCAVLIDSVHNVLVLVADDRRFELPAGFAARLRSRLAREFEDFKTGR